MHVGFYNNLDLCLKKSDSLRTLSLCLYTLRRNSYRDCFDTNENKHIPHGSKENSSLYVPRNANISFYLLWYYFLLFLLQSLFPRTFEFLRLHIQVNMQQICVLELLHRGIKQEVDGNFICGNRRQNYYEGNLAQCLTEKRGMIQCVLVKVELHALVTHCGRVTQSAFLTR